MASTKKAATDTISWYRTPIDRSRLKELTTRNDLRALAQAGGFLLIYLCTTGTTLYFFLQEMWIAMVVSAYIHSLFHGFLGTGAAVHELSHSTPFKRKRLNLFFIRIFAFLTWTNHEHFRESHRRHHKYTAYDDRDFEIKREPIGFTKPQVIGWFLFDWANFKRLAGTHIRHALGNTDADFFLWNPLYERDEPGARQLIRWSRTLILGHLALIAIFAYFELWILIYTVNFGYFFASFLVHGCEILQHAGLPHNIPDWRVNASSARFGPLMSFLYWNMNFHCEHHMYAAVPFYNLPRLHEELKPDLPEQIPGYWRGLLRVLRIKKRQKIDPGYRFVPEFPETAAAPRMQ